MKRIFTITLILLMGMSVFAQFEQYETQEVGRTKTTKKDTAGIGSRLVFGGDFGLQLGTYTLIKVSPAMGYYLTSYLMPGVSFTYIYSSNKLYHTRGNIFGGSAFLEAFPLGFAVIHAEYERLWVNFSYTNQPYWTESYLAGVGYRQQIGRKGMINYLVLWDFNYSGNTIYSNPRFKIIMLF